MMVRYNSHRKILKKYSFVNVRYPVTYSLWKAYIHCQSTVLEHF